MRVIAGKYKKAALKAVPGNLTRPTTDRNKETIFNWLTPYIQGGRVLDLFAGSGALGIEALSRGMDELYAVDISGKACAVIRENLASLRVTEKCAVLKMSWPAALKKFHEQNIRFDLVLMDPPYEKGFSARALDALWEVLNPGAVVFVEEGSGVSLRCEQLTLLKHAVYRQTGFWIWRKTP